MDSPPTQLASHHRRLYALIIDGSFIVAVVHLLHHLLLEKHWDLMSTEQTFRAWHWILGLTLLVIRDLPHGVSLGKWVCAIQVTSLEPLGFQPACSSLCLRNLVLILLPVETLWVFINPYYRRIGDLISNTVVVANTSAVPAIRRLTGASSAYFLLLLVALGLIRWNVQSSAAYQTAVRYAAAHPFVQAQTKGSVRFGWLVSLDLQSGHTANKARVLLSLRNSSKIAEIELHTELLGSSQRRWKAERLRWVDAGQQQ